MSCWGTGQERGTAVSHPCGRMTKTNKRNQKQEKELCLPQLETFFGDRVRQLRLSSVSVAAFCCRYSSQLSSDWLQMEKRGFSSCAFNIPAVPDVKQVLTSALGPPKGSHRCVCVPSSSLFRSGSILHAWLLLPPPLLSSINSKKNQSSDFGEKEIYFPPVMSKPSF